MTDISGRLAPYLERMLATPFEWGVCDCELYPADWWVLAGHADPARAYRGRYRTALGARRLINRARGLVALTMATMGPPADGVAKLGDVGLIPAQTAWCGEDLVGAIHTGNGRWAAKSQSGLLIGTASPLYFWSV